MEEKMFEYLTDSIKEAGCMRRMKELTESNDLLAEPRVIAAYDAMCRPDQERSGFYMMDQIAAGEPLSGPIPGSIADVAFAMRDACDKREWYRYMRLIASRLWPDDYDCWIIEESGPEHWIVAAVLAWEVSQTK